MYFANELPLAVWHMVLLFTAFGGFGIEEVSFFFLILNFLFAVQYPPANWSRPVYAEGTVAFEKEDLSTSSRMNAFMWSFFLFQAV